MSGAVMKKSIEQWARDLSDDDRAKMIEALLAKFKTDEAQRSRPAR